MTRVFGRAERSAARGGESTRGGLPLIYNIQRTISRRTFQRCAGGGTPPGRKCCGPAPGAAEPMCARASAAGRATAPRVLRNGGGGNGGSISP